MRVADNFGQIKDIALALTIPGYYMLLALALELNLTSTAVLSIPYRITLVVAMTLCVLVTWRIDTRRSLLRTFPLMSAAVTLFWIWYLARLLYDVFILDEPLSRARYEYPLYAITFCILPFLFFSTSLTNNTRSALPTGRWLTFGCLCLCLAVPAIYHEAFAESAGRLRGLEEDTQSTLSPLAVSYVAAYLAGRGTATLLFKNDAARVGIVYILAATPSLLMGSSRGSVLAYLFSLGLLLAIRRRLSIILTSILLLAVAAILLTVLGDVIGSNLVERITETSSDKYAQRELRILMWEESLRQFLSGPIIGDYVENRTFNHHPHNIIIEAFMATGIIGGIPFLIIIIYTIILASRIAYATADHDWLLILLFQSLAQNMVTGSIWGGAWLWAAIGLTLSVYAAIAAKNTGAPRIPAKI